MVTAMAFLNGISVLLVFQLLGEVIVLLLQWSVPGPVVGMFLLFVALMLRGMSGDSLQDSADALLGHLSLLFIPAGVGVMAHFDLIAAAWLPIAAALLLGTLLTMAVTAALMVVCLRYLDTTEACHD